MVWRVWLRAKQILVICGTKLLTNVLRSSSQLVSGNSIERLKRLHPLSTVKIGTILLQQSNIPCYFKPYSPTTVKKVRECNTLKPTLPREGAPFPLKTWKNPSPISHPQTFNMITRFLRFCMSLKTHQWVCLARWYLSVNLAGKPYSNTSEGPTSSKVVGEIPQTCAQSWEFYPLVPQAQFCPSEGFLTFDW